jgi:hypothetical protein
MAGCDFAIKRVSGSLEKAGEAASYQTDPPTTVPCTVRILLNGALAALGPNGDFDVTAVSGDLIGLKARKDCPAGVLTMIKTCPPDETTGACQKTVALEIGSLSDIGVEEILKTLGLPLTLAALPLWVLAVVAAILLGFAIGGKKQAEDAAAQLVKGGARLLPCWLRRLF